MKIQILTQNIKNRDVLLQGLAMARAYANTIGINFEYTFKETSKQFHSFNFTNTAVGSAVAVDGNEILAETDPGFKISCLIFDRDSVVPPPTNPVQQPILKDGCNPIQIPEQWYSDFTKVPPHSYADVLCAYFLHEICHSGFFFSNNVVGDVTHKQHSYPEWTNKQSYEYYLSLLEKLKPWLEVATPVSYPLLRLRSTNKVAVKELQTLLNSHGAKLLVDGGFGPVTLKAVIAFQKSKALSGDGVVGNKTWTELKKKPNSSIKKTLIEAIIQVESNGNLKAIGDTGLKYPAYGPMQIRQPVCIDVNKKFGTNYKSTDCLGNKELSIDIWNKYQSIYNPQGSDEEKSRTWNGGPGWRLRPHLTDGYWDKVRVLL